MTKEAKTPLETVELILTDIAKAKIGSREEELRVKMRYELVHEVGADYAEDLLLHTVFMSQDWDNDSFVACPVEQDGVIKMLIDWATWSTAETLDQGPFAGKTYQTPSGVSGDED